MKTLLVIVGLVLLAGCAQEHPLPMFSAQCHTMQQYEWSIHSATGGTCLYPPIVDPQEMLKREIEKGVLLVGICYKSCDGEECSQCDEQLKSLLQSCQVTYLNGAIVSAPVDCSQPQAAECVCHDANPDFVTCR